MTDEQKKKLSETEDAVRQRLVDPWTSKLHDLILYKTMHAYGVRISDIDGLIAKELRKG